MSKKRSTFTGKIGFIAANMHFGGHASHCTWTDKTGKRIIAKGK